MAQQGSSQADLSSTSSHSAHTDDGPASRKASVDGSASAEGISGTSVSTANTSLQDSEFELDNAEEQEEEEGTRNFPSLFAPSLYPGTSILHFGREDDFDSTRSIEAGDLNYVWENGRRYCGPYYMPNDEAETDRLALMHVVYCSAFDGELTCVPLENPTAILDVGTATGEWAADIADRFPQCEVIGMDLASVFRKPSPPNVFWEVDDAEVEWERAPNVFDLVHFRNMAGAFKDWTFIYKQAFGVIKPGGWIEVLDYDDYWAMQNFMSYFEPGSIIHRVTRDVQDAAALSGRAQGIGHLEPQLLRDAGFTDIEVTEHDIPFSPSQMSTGHLWLLAISLSIEATTLRLLTTYKGWSADEVRIAVSMLQEELQAMALNPERARGFVMKIKVLTGRKSDAPSPSAPQGNGNREAEQEAVVDQDESEHHAHEKPARGRATSDPGVGKGRRIHDQSPVSSEGGIMTRTPSDMSNDRQRPSSERSSGGRAGLDTSKIHEGKPITLEASSVVKEEEDGLELMYPRADGAVLTAPTSSTWTRNAST